MGPNDVLARQKPGEWADAPVRARIDDTSARMAPVCAQCTEGEGTTMDVREALTGVVTTLVDLLTDIAADNQVLAQWRLLLQQYPHVQWQTSFSDGQYCVEVVGPPDPALSARPRYARVQETDLATALRQALRLTAKANIERRRFPVHPVVREMVAYIFADLNGALSRDALVTVFGDQMSQRQVNRFISALEAIDLASPAVRHTVPNRPRRILVQNAAEALHVLAYHPEITFHEQDGRLLFGPKENDNMDRA